MEMKSSELRLAIVLVIALILFCQHSLVSGQLPKALNDDLNSLSSPTPLSSTSNPPAITDETPSSSTHLRQLRKQLRGKQRRLRKLVGEIKGLKAKLAEPEGPARHVNGVGNAGFSPNATIKRTKTSWRRRVMGELKRLNEQIRIISYKPSNQTDESRLNRRRKLNKNRGEATGKKKPLDEVTTPSIIVSSSQQTEDQAKLRFQIRRMRNKRKRLKKIKSMWKNKPSPGAEKTSSNKIIGVPKGEPGYHCKSHKDCRPGSCCHKISATNSTSICFEHRLDVGVTCANSCQCVHGLNCFRTRKDKLSHKKSTTFDFAASNHDDHQHDHGQCKIATTDDVLHGEYVNNDNFTFTSLDFK